MARAEKRGGIRNPLGMMRTRKTMISRVGVATRSTGPRSTRICSNSSTASTTTRPWGQTGRGRGQGPRELGWPVRKWSSSIGSLANWTRIGKFRSSSPDFCGPITLIRLLFGDRSIRYENITLFTWGFSWKRLPDENRWLMAEKMRCC